MSALLASTSTVHQVTAKLSLELTSMLRKAGILKPCAKLLDGVDKVVWGLTLLEGCCINKVAIQGSNLAGEGLDKHTNGHTRWEGMRIDDQIRPA